MSLFIDKSESIQDEQSIKQPLISSYCEWFQDKSMAHSASIYSNLVYRNDSEVYARKISELVQEDLKDRLSDQQLTNLVFTATINKICQEHQVFFGSKSRVLVSLQGKIFTFYKFISENDTIDFDENVFKHSLLNFFDRLSQKNTFLSIILCFFITIALGWVAAIFLFITMKKEQSRKREIALTVFALCIISIFFYTCLMLIIKQELNGIFLDCVIVAILEIFASCVYFLMYNSTQMISRKYSNQFENLIISTDLLFYEMIDREDFQQYINIHSYNFNEIYSVLRSIPQQPNKLLQQTIKGAQNKVWNTGYFMLKDYSKHIEYKSKEKYFDIIVKKLNILLILCFLVVPIYFVFADSSRTEGYYYIFKISFFVLVLACKSINYYFNSYSNVIMETFQCNVVLISSLIEINNKFADFEITKGFSTINIYCLQTIQTWKQVREICLSFIQKYFLNLNLVHSLDLLLVVLYTTALIVDYRGFFWSKNKIIDSRFLLCYIVLSIVQKILISLVYIFNKFSSMNKFLKYNSDQVYRIYQKLLYLQQMYQLLRKSTIQYITDLLIRKKIQYKNFNYFSIFEDNISDIKEMQFRPIRQENSQINEIMRDNMKIQSLFSIKSIFEIQRNALYYLQGQNNEEQLNSDQQIQLEETYLADLIDLYQNIIVDFKEHENKYKIKFLGLIPLEYGTLYVGLTLLIPAVASYFIKQFINI